jgi:predicted enzyme related to lactoylglutathione lyase
VGNPVVHFELAAADHDLLVAFYGNLFDWRLRSLSNGGYTIIDTCAGHGINGGIARSQPGRSWSTFYVEVADLQETLDKVSSLGGTTIMPVTELAGPDLADTVRIAMFSDPDDLPVGIVQERAEDSGVYASEPSPGSGEMLDWFEVMGSDAARTRHFYSELFDWTLDDAGFADYATVDTGTDRGVQGGLGGGVEYCWSTTYAWVADFDQALDRAEQLGGSPVRDRSVPELKDRARRARFGYLDTMKTGAFRDPAGNVFGIFEFNEKT